MHLFLLSLLFIAFSVFAMEEELGLPRAQYMREEQVEKEKALYLFIHNQVMIKFLQKIKNIKEYNEGYDIDNLQTFYRIWYQEKIADQFNFSQEKFKKKYNEEISCVKRLQGVAKKYNIKRAIVWLIKNHTSHDQTRLELIMGMALPKKADKASCAEKMMEIPCVKRIEDETGLNSLRKFDSYLQREKKELRTKEKIIRKHVYSYLDKIQCTCCFQDIKNLCSDELYDDEESQVPCCACGLPSTGTYNNTYCCYCICFDLSWLECLFCLCQG